MSQDDIETVMAAIGDPDYDHIVTDAAVARLMRLEARLHAAEADNTHNLRRLEELAVKYRESQARLHAAEEEREELRTIRELCIKALVKATGADEDSIREAPLTNAIKSRAELDRLREALERIAAVLLHPNHDSANLAGVRDIARAALTQEESHDSGVES